ncbi:TBC1 domain family member 20-like [Pollicipes pollicipes]|uniref:TBC1 domain family member 20-like n=1 Tax=Pollicipes pollicipes TaxID=41117 RepID=UPI0018855B77|nr:TBC1 domain family member 20-like [Pollicipes pollicipes]
MTVVSPADGEGSAPGNAAAVRPAAEAEHEPEPRGDLGPPSDVTPPAADAAGVRAADPAAGDSEADDSGAAGTDSEAAGTDERPGPPTVGDNDSDSEGQGEEEEEDEEEVWRQQKRDQLLTQLRTEPLDMAAVRELALSPGGLLEDALRRRVWPLLLRPDRRLPEAPPLSDAELRDHPYHHQVLLDVERTLKRFPPGIDDQVRFSMQEGLVRVIVRSLAAHPELHYYQGYHDVAITVLLVCGEQLALPVLCHLAAHQLRVFMAPTMEETRDLLTYVLPLLEAEDPPVCEFLLRSEAMATFALSWLITWFSHVLPDFALITRLFDYVLATSWLSPVYLAAAVVLHRRDELLAGECDLAAVHSLLADIPAHLPWERLLARASRLLAELPPERLQPRVDALNRVEDLYGQSLVILSPFLGNRYHKAFTLHLWRASAGLMQV